MAHGSYPLAGALWRPERTAGGKFYFLALGTAPTAMPHGPTCHQTTSDHPHTAVGRRPCHRVRRTAQAVWGRGRDGGRGVGGGGVVSMSPRRLGTPKCQENHLRLLNSVPFCRTTAIFVVVRQFLAFVFCTHLRTSRLNTLKRI